jgi:hypothetical protein
MMYVCVYVKYGPREGQTDIKHVGQKYYEKCKWTGSLPWGLEQ